MHSGGGKRCGASLIEGHNLPYTQIDASGSLCVSIAARSKSMVMGEVSRGPCRPASPGLQEGALKAGWLKKQRSIMKNWQLRWFVLRHDQLYFYKDEEETKPQVYTGLCIVYYVQYMIWL